MFLKRGINSLFFYLFFYTKKVILIKKWGVSMNVNEKVIEGHNDFINEIMLRQLYGYKDICELYIGRDWTLYNKEYVSFGKRLSLVSGNEEITEQNHYFIHEKKGKRIAEIMNEDGTFSKIELSKPAILYTYICDIACCLEDRENQFVKSYNCYFWIMEYENKMYIPKMYSLEEVFRKQHPKDVDLQTLIEEVHLDTFDDIDKEMLEKLINTIAINGLTEIAEKLEEECGEKTFNDAVLSLKKDMLSLKLSEIKLIKKLIEDYQKEYVDIVKEEIQVVEDEDVFDEIDDGYIRSRVWFSVRKLKKNNMLLITMQGAEDPFERVSLKLVARKKYFNNQEILASAFNNLCFSLVFQNQCWFKEYEGQ